MRAFVGRVGVLGVVLGLVAGAEGGVSPSSAPPKSSGPALAKRRPLGWPLRAGQGGDDKGRVGKDRAVDKHNRQESAVSAEAERMQEWFCSLAEKRGTTLCRNRRASARARRRALRRGKPVPRTAAPLEEVQDMVVGWCSRDDNHDSELCR